MHNHWISRILYKTELSIYILSNPLNTMPHGTRWPCHRARPETDGIMTPYNARRMIQRRPAHPRRLRQTRTSREAEARPNAMPLLNRAWIQATPPHSPLGRNCTCTKQHLHWYNEVIIPRQPIQQYYITILTYLIRLSHRINKYTHN